MGVAVILAVFGRIDGDAVMLGLVDPFPVPSRVGVVNRDVTTGWGTIASASSVP
jgi:hypothetical protein